MSSVQTSDVKKTVRRLDWIRGVLILTLVLYVAVTLVINSKYLTADRLLRMRSDLSGALRGRTETPVPLGSETVDVQLFQDGCAVLSLNGLTVYGSSGAVYSERTLRYAEPRMVIAGQYILCFDRGGTEWCLMNTFRMLCSGTESAPIISGSVSDQGYFSVSTEKFEYKGCLTVYNTDGIPLARWNADSYLVDAFFTSRSEVTLVTLLSEEEKVSTVFRVFSFRTGEIAATATLTDIIPYALAQKSDGSVEMLSAAGAWRFDGETISALYAYRDTEPGIYYQGADATMICYTANGSRQVDAVDNSGKVLFSAEYPSVVSLCCFRDYYFVLTGERLFVLDASGAVLSDTETSASSILASPEVVFLRSSSDVKRLNLSSIL